MENVMNNTSKVFESHIRIQMIASLSIEDLTYKQMKEILGCTDGNMTTHTKKLIQEGLYIRTVNHIYSRCELYFRSSKITFIKRLF